MGLWPWLLAVPSYPPTATLDQVLADLAQIGGAPWPSHIIVVDAHQRPQGALALGWLWVRQQGEDPAAVALQACLAHLEPVTIVLADTDPADLEGTPAALSTSCWVGVDADGTYRGTVNRLALVDQGYLPQVERSFGQRRLRAASDQEQQWVMAIGHALKTPLTSLLGLSTLLLDHRVGPLNDRQARYATLMRRAIRKLIRLVNQLVDWMRLEAGQMDLEAEAVDLRSLTETLLPTFLTSWLPDAVAPPPWMATFSCYLPSGLPPLKADQRRVQQSLYGVLGYLLHRGATPQALTLEPWGHWIGLTLRAEAPDTEAPASVPWTVTLGVEVDSLETLGLALARRLCQQQGGDLVGFCSPRDGYQITLLFPPDRSQADTGAEGDTELEHLVLLVSTDGEQVMALQEHRTDQTIRLLLATGWEEAVDLAQRLTPSLVLLDQPSLTDLPPNPLAILAQMVPRPGALVMINSADSLASALAALPRLSPGRETAAPPAGSVPSSPTLLILAYRGRSPLAPGALDTDWQTKLQRQRCRLVQADDLVQARLLCRVWQPQAIVLMGGEGFTAEDWDWVAQCPELMQRPWIRLSPLAGPVPSDLVVIDGAHILAPSSTEDLVHLIQMLQLTQG